ncbi:MAG: peptide deformylase [Spirochaetales bacterium]|nr:peptide deformylase [Spirochaetales bacterium]
MKKKPRKIIILGDERLHEKSLPVEAYNGELEGLAEDMFRTLAAKKGLGLAAVQVGVLTRVFITQLSEDGQRVFVNPTIIETSEELVEIEEGCLSVPKMYERVNRPTRVRVQAFTLKGKPYTLEAGGLLARVIQHEIDHLDGILFIDRLDEAAKARIVKSFRSPGVLPSVPAGVRPI